MSEADIRKQPRRPHYIAEWMEKKGVTAAELSRAIGASESVISRWIHGGSPGVEWQAKLSYFFGIDRAGLFMHPDEYWVKQFFAGRNRQEIERIKATFEAAFPRADKGEES